MKFCGSCGETKQFFEFYGRARREKYPTTPAGFHSECKECTKLKRSKYRNKKRAENPNWQKEMDLKQMFGISMKDWNNLFDSQNGCCAICNIHQSELKRKLAVDHCHSTGKIRGLLCSACNIAIGALKEDIQIFKTAISYIEKFKSTSGEVIPLKKEG